MISNDKTDAEKVAAEHMNVADWRKMEAEGLSAEEFLEREHGVDPDDHDDAEELHAAVLSARKLNGDADHKGTDAGDDTGTMSASTSVSTGGHEYEYEYEDTEVAALAESVMTVSDWRDAERADASPVEYVHDTYGVDPREHRTEAGLRQAIDQEAER